VVVPTTLDRAFEGAALFRDVEDEFDRTGIRLVSDFAVSRVGATPRTATNAPTATACAVSLRCWRCMRNRPC
jgi:hypothetical protein